MRCGRRSMGGVFLRVEGDVFVTELGFGWEKGEEEGWWCLWLGVEMELLLVGAGGGGG